jgi:drug/metabolite transporter (DMT)-like permease
MVAVHYLLLSVACSVLVSVLLKLARGRGIDVSQAITWNYLSASLLCVWLLQPAPIAFSTLGAHGGVLLALGVLLPTIFLALAASVRVAGIVRSDIAQRMSLLGSLAAAFLWFGEPLNGGKLFGLALGLVAVPCIVLRSDSSRSGVGIARWVLPLLVLLGFAAIDVLLKLVASAGIPFASSLQFSFGLAFVLMLALQLYRHQHRQTRIGLRQLCAGLLLGAVNFGNIVFYIRAHQSLPDQPATVFATMNIGVVLLGTLVGWGLFGERLNRINQLGVVLAVAAILVITAARY